MVQPKIWCLHKTTRFCVLRQGNDSLCILFTANPVLVTSPAEKPMSNTFHSSSPLLDPPGALYKDKDNEDNNDNKNNNDKYNN